MPDEQKRYFATPTVAAESVVQRYRELSHIVLALVAVGAIFCAGLELWAVAIVLASALTVLLLYYFASVHAAKPLPDRDWVEVGPAGISCSTPYASVVKLSWHDVKSASLDEFSLSIEESPTKAICVDKCDFDEETWQYLTHDAFVFLRSSGFQVASDSLIATRDDVTPT